VTTAHRYAIYWTPPPTHALWQAGCDWLSSERPATTAPRRYGFHATLKAPMALRPGTDESDFLDAVRRLAGRMRRFAMPPLVVTTLGDFMALRPATSVSARHPLRRLADACVRELDDWRAPLDDAALRERLRRQPVSAQQETLLRRWGYAHVFDQWRFHMTLSDSLPPDGNGNSLRHRIVAEAQRFFAPALDLPLDCDALCVFVEPAPGAAFVAAHRFALAAATS
jgi:hypothetical protein